MIHLGYVSNVTIDASRYKLLRLIVTTKLTFVHAVKHNFLLRFTLIAFHLVLQLNFRHNNVISVLFFLVHGLSYSSTGSTSSDAAATSGWLHLRERTLILMIWRAPP